MSEITPKKRKETGNDYRTYKLSPGEYFACAGIWLAVSVFLGELFFHSIIFSLLIFCLLQFLLKYYKKLKKEKRLEEFSFQFCDAAGAYAAAISSGFSPENAVDEALRELNRIYGKDSMMGIEFAAIRRKLAVGETIESALIDISERSGVSEIREMGEIFSQAKRSGGSLPDILRHTAEMLEEKRRLKEEIRTIITAKKLEHRIMCVMPAAILLYLNLTGTEFVSALYDGPRGKIIMGAALILYLFAIALGEKIVRVDI